jgi:quercetin dioxygenase-like cupin family protein
MKIVDMNSISPPGQEVAIFQGSKHGANVSFFVVQFSRGRGPRKHRHPYEEVFIIQDGEIEAIIDGKMERIGAGKVAIIPARSWHEFKACSRQPVSMINIHPVPEMITEWA